MGERRMGNNMPSYKSVHQMKHIQTSRITCKENETKETHSYRYKHSATGANASHHQQRACTKTQRSPNTRPQRITANILLDQYALCTEKASAARFFAPVRFCRWRSIQSACVDIAQRTAQHETRQMTRNRLQTIDNAHSTKFIRRVSSSFSLRSLSFYLNIIRAL